MARLTPEQHRERAIELRIEGEQLAALTEEPGWKTIRAELDRRRAKVLDDLTKAGELPVRKFDYDRGFIAGAEWLLSIPEEALKTLASAERSARTLLGLKEGDDL